ncbi:TonB-dependent receptor [Geothrix sp. 21YS21S-2]|uniref:TonB-dependent receptor n=1 Tax=Geothrix sp. 21YS21S-2 TaxID=3068893 RepID=UPI0027BB0BF5|nr:TonB-dependent receptor [Geothrix sp. 21YS21S-2]
MIRPGHSSGPGRLCALIVASSTLLFSQSAAVGNLTGQVTGPGGKPMAGALVQVDTGRGVREFRTAADGRFMAPQLMPGTVKIHVTAKGMTSFRTQVNIVSNQNVTVNVPLALVAEAFVEVVAIQAPEVGVDPNVAVTGRNFDSAAIANLPNIGSNPYNAALKTLPGTPSGGYNFHGAEDGGNNYTINGVESRSASGGIQLLPLNPDLIEQFNVLSAGVSAKYGRFVGGVVNTVTKSGSNTFEGSVRHDFTSDSWNALPRQSAYTTSKRVPRHVTDVQSYTFLGPIIKDTLFFAVGYKTTTPSVTTVQTGSVGSGLFAPYTFTTTSGDELKDIRLDWQVNADNRVSGSWSRYLSTRSGSSSGRGISTIAAGNGPLRSEKSYKSLSWTSTLASNLLLDVIVSETLKKDGGPGTGSQGGAGVVTWMDTKGAGNNDLYDNGVNAGNLNQEKIRTLGVNLAWSNAGHSVEGGLQYYHSRIDSMGSYAGSDGGYAAMSPSHAIIRFYGWEVAAPPSMDRVYRNLEVNDSNRTKLVMFDPLQGGADTRIIGLFANDVWTLDNHWTINVGVRYDRNQVDLDPEGDRFTATSVTPRLSASYDLQGNTRHVFTLSLAEYAGQYNVSTFSATSVSNTVPVRQYKYYGAGNGGDALNANGSVNWSVWGKSATELGEGNPYQATANPLASRKVTADPNIKPPRSREATLSYRYTDPRQSLSATFIHKIQDNYVGLKYLGAPGTAAAAAPQQYFTDSGMEARYEGLEVQYKRQITPEFNVGGNFSWSYTRANAGQGVGNSSRNQFGNFIPNDLVDPFGPQPGQWSSSSTPLTMHLDATYTHSFGKAGKLEVSMLGNYWGRSFRGYRTFNGPTSAAVQSYGYPSSVTRYYADSPTWWPEQFGFDLHVGYEIELYKKITFFTALDVLNVFNHMQPMFVNYSTALTDGTQVFKPYDPTIATVYPDWYTNPNLRPVPYNAPNPTNNPSILADGQTGDYTAPRKIQVRVGFRF